MNLKFKDGYYCDVRCEKRYVSNVQYTGNNLTECKETVIDKAFIRIYDGKLWYYCSTDSRDDIQAEMDRLYACAGKPDADIENNVTVKKFEINKAEHILYAKEKVSDVPLDKKRDFIEKRKKYAETDEYLKLATVSYNDRYSLYEFVSSLGADIVYDVQYASLRLNLSLAYGRESFDDTLVKNADSFEKLKLGKDELNSFMKDADDFLLSAKSVQSGKYPVVLSPAVAGVFAHESFGHKSEADFMLGDETMKKEWALGKRVASDILSIYDDGGIFGTGYVPYDDEGTKSKRTYLIKDGILSGRLHSVSTAADLGEEPTGNARAVSCDYEPIVRMTSTIIEGKGSDSFDDLISRIKYGYYIKSFKHGSGGSTFTIAPSLAYRIENGKITCPVKIAVISGNLFETLEKIDGVTCKDDVFVAGGNCGKGEQFPLKVAMGGAYLSISEMDIQ
ncbi:MAG: TldD/PmbA family protein [Clostridia bacterium]|nr:TldD/PmbA family protein [Clostridia bacterium]